MELTTARKAHLEELIAIHMGNIETLQIKINNSRMVGLVDFNNLRHEKKAVNAYTRELDPSAELPFDAVENPQLEIAGRELRKNMHPGEADHYMQMASIFLGNIYHLQSEFNRLAQTLPLSDSIFDQIIAMIEEQEMCVQQMEIQLFGETVMSEES